jgi:hypothetical protein
MTAAAKPTTMTGRARHEVHPAALAFPEMPAAELEELADDIKQNGLAHPIVLSADGIILDGRNRLRACHRGVDSHNDSLSHNGAACGRLFRRRERDTALPSRASVVNAWFRGGRCLLAAPDRVRRWALQMMVGTATRQTVLQGS